MDATLNPDYREKPGILNDMNYDSKSNWSPREKCDSEEDPNPKISQKNENRRNHPETTLITEGTKINRKANILSSNSAADSKI